MRTEVIPAAAIWLTRYALARAGLDGRSTMLKQAVTDDEAAVIARLVDAESMRPAGKRLFDVFTRSRKQDYTSLMGAKSRTPLQQFAHEALGYDTEGSYLRLPSGKSYFRATGTPSKPRSDHVGRSIYTSLYGEARPERARAIAERMYRDPELAEKVEQVIAGTRKAHNVRLPRNGAGSIAPGTVTQIISGKPRTQSLVGSLAEHLRGSARKLPLADKARLIKDIGYTDPGTVRSVARAALASRRDIYRLMRQSGFGRFRGLSAAVLPKDRRVAAVLGGLAALTGTGVGAYKLLKKPEEKPVDETRNVQTAESSKLQRLPTRVLEYIRNMI